MKILLDSTLALDPWLNSIDWLIVLIPEDFPTRLEYYPLRVYPTHTADGEPEIGNIKNNKIKISEERRLSRMKNQDYFTEREFKNLNYLITEIPQRKMNPKIKSNLVIFLFK